MHQTMNVSLDILMNDQPVEPSKALKIMNSWEPLFSENPSFDPNDINTVKAVLLKEEKRILKIKNYSDSSTSDAQNEFSIVILTHAPHITTFILTIVFALLYEVFTKWFLALYIFISFIIHCGISFLFIYYTKNNCKCCCCPKFNCYRCIKKKCKCLSKLRRHCASSLCNFENCCDCSSCCCCCNCCKNFCDVLIDSIVSASISICGMIGEVISQLILPKSNKISQVALAAFLAILFYLITSAILYLLHKKCGLKDNIIVEI